MNKFSGKDYKTEMKCNIHESDMVNFFFDGVKLFDHITLRFYVYDNRHSE